MTAVSRAVHGITGALLVPVALAVTAAGLVVVGSTSASAAAPADSADRIGTSAARLTLGSDSYEARVQQYVNKKRARHGLGPLRFDSCTDSVAEAWASNLAITGLLLHQDSAKIITTCSARYAGETLGRGGYSPRGLVNAWMRSSAHRPILLSRRAERIGIGSVDVGGLWVTAASFTRY